MLRRLVTTSLRNKLPVHTLDKLRGISRVPAPLPSTFQAQRHSHTTTNIMADNLPDAFKNGTLYSDDRKYTFLKLPIASTAPALDFLKSCHDTPPAKDVPFQTCMLDKDEITMMVPTSQFESQFEAANFPEFEKGPIQYRMITFDVVLAPTLVGFMAMVTRALADANVSVLPFAAYSRDHIFVSDKDFDTTMQVLEKLKNSTK